MTAPAALNGPAALGALGHWLALLCLYQVAWLRDHSPVKVWEKSRRIGASWVEALYTVLAAAKKKSEGGQSTYYLSYNKDMTRQFIKDCAWWAKVLGFVCGNIEEIAQTTIINDIEKDVTIFRITFASGNVVEGLPSEARSLRSKQGRVVLDEAAFVDDLQELQKAAMALLMWGGQVVILSTHNGEENPFNELLAEIRAGKLPYSLHRTDLDEALAGGLYKAICRKKGDPWTPEKQTAWRESTIAEYAAGADEELFCIPSRSGGAWLTGALIESCMPQHDTEETMPPALLEWSPEIARAALAGWMEDIGPGAALELYATDAQGVATPSGEAPVPLSLIADWLRTREFVDIPVPVAAGLVQVWCERHLAPVLATLHPLERHYIGEDFARRTDLTVITLAAQQENLHKPTRLMLELRNTPFRVQEQFLAYIGHNAPRLSGLALDAGGNGMALAEFARQTWGESMVKEVLLSEGWYRENMPRVKSNLEDRTTTLPKSANIKDDFRAVRLVRGVPRVPPQRTGEKGKARHGDSVVSFALALFAEAVIEVEEAFEVLTGAPSHLKTLFKGY
ncbi:terminase large subunit domain-containing protein [Desulfovibrio cuneatus]|uniref:terminase large subunit domain-containing protein n=1 Tax=Desulfovibrio cuneatus TaxID=159728 RepID=UPI00041CB0B5|nr:terminase family protein [Desulfovibrio cuneatus]